MCVVEMVTLCNLTEIYMQCSTYAGGAVAGCGICPEHCDSQYPTILKFAMSHYFVQGSKYWQCHLLGTVIFNTNQ